MGRGWLHPQVWQSLRAQHTAHTDVETLFPGTWAPHFDGGVGGLSDLVDLRRYKAIPGMTGKRLSKQAKHWWLHLFRVRLCLFPTN